jgi:hypothetical protein
LKQVQQKETTVIADRLFACIFRILYMNRSFSPPGRNQRIVLVHTRTEPDTRHRITGYRVDSGYELSDAVLWRASNGFFGCHLGSAWNLSQRRCSRCMKESNLADGSLSNTRRRPSTCHTIAKFQRLVITMVNHVGSPFEEKKQARKWCATAKDHTTLEYGSS